MSSVSLKSLGFLNASEKLNSPAEDWYIFLNYYARPSLLTGERVFFYFFTITVNNVLQRNIIYQIEREKNEISLYITSKTS